MVYGVWCLVLCFVSVSPPCGAIGGPVVFDCGISCKYLFISSEYLDYNNKKKNVTQLDSLH